MRRFRISQIQYVNRKKIEPKEWRKQRASKIDIKKLEEDVENDLDTYQYERAKRLEVRQTAVHFGLKGTGEMYKKHWSIQRQAKKAYHIFTKNRTI